MPDANQWQQDTSILLPCAISITSCEPLWCIRSWTRWAPGSIQHGSYVLNYLSKWAKSKMWLIKDLERSSLTLKRQMGRTFKETEKSGLNGEKRCKEECLGCNHKILLCKIYLHVFYTCYCLPAESDRDSITRNQNFPSSTLWIQGYSKQTFHHLLDSGVYICFHTPIPNMHLKFGLRRSLLSSLNLSYFQCM